MDLIGIDINPDKLGKSKIIDITTVKMKSECTIEFNIIKKLVHLIDE